MSPLIGNSVSIMGDQSQNEQVVFVFRTAKSNSSIPASIGQDQQGRQDYRKKKNTWRITLAS